MKFSKTGFQIGQGRYYEKKNSLKKKSTEEVPSGNVFISVGPAFSKQKHSRVLNFYFLVVFEFSTSFEWSAQNLYLLSQ